MCACNCGSDECDLDNVCTECGCCPRCCECDEYGNEGDDYDYGEP